MDIRSILVKNMMFSLSPPLSGQQLANKAAFSIFIFFFVLSDYFHITLFVSSSLSCFQHPEVEELGGGFLNLTV